MALIGLEESEKKYQAIVEMTGIGFFIMDADGKILEANAEYMRFTGRGSLDKVVGHRIFEWTAPHDLERNIVEVKKCVKQGFVRNLEIDYIDKQGKITSIEINAMVIGSGKTLQIVAINHDITKHKQAEESLRQNKTMLDEIMQIAQFGSWEYDVFRDEFTFNDQFYLIFRTTAKKEGGYKMSPKDYAKKFVHPDDMAFVGVEIKKAMETTDPNYSSHLDHRIIRADGTTGYITVYIRIGKDKQGKTIRQFGINQDISERKELQQELSLKINELEKINKFMIDRELTMIKLKKEIALLKSAR